MVVWQTLQVTLEFPITHFRILVLSVAVAVEILATLSVQPRVTFAVY